MLLAATNSGTLIIALPDLERSLHTSLLTLVWVILAYMIASTVLVLSAGRLSDQFGRKKAYLGGFLVFAVASLGAGFAANGTNPDVVVGGSQEADAFAQIKAMIQLKLNPKWLYESNGANSPADFPAAVGANTEGVFSSIAW